MYLPLVRLAFAAMLCVPAVTISTQAAGPDKKGKPTVSVKVTPVIGFSPARMVLTAELRGGADDYEEFYCATVEWEWGDDTRSESKTDCDPYEAGKSTIKRHYTAEHTYRDEGAFTARFKVKQGKRVVVSTTTTVQVREGVRSDLD